MASSISAPPDPFQYRNPVVEPILRLANRKMVRIKKYRLRVVHPSGLINYPIMDTMYNELRIEVLVPTLLQQDSLPVLQGFEKRRAPQKITQDRIIDEPKPSSRLKNGQRHEERGSKQFVQVCNLVRRCIEY